MSDSDDVQMGFVAGAATTVAFLLLIFAFCAPSAAETKQACVTFAQWHAAQKGSITFTQLEDGSVIIRGDAEALRLHSISTQPYTEPRPILTLQPEGTK